MHNSQKAKGAYLTQVIWDSEQGCAFAEAAGVASRLQIRRDSEFHPLNAPFVESTHGQQTYWGGLTATLRYSWNSRLVQHHSDVR